MSLPSIFNRSLYWLFPVVLLNVFTSVGLQERIVLLPTPVSTEQVREVLPAPVAYDLAATPMVTPLAVGQPWLGLRRRLIVVATAHLPKEINGVFPDNPLLRFYGKAAPEALDRWSFSTQG